ncbi:MAG TPA: MraY family glycosyltransferase [Planctomycetota bacterium]|nr:MraY family glycosyltransferase [Planctomycetota bacterium]
MSGLQPYVLALVSAVTCAALVPFAKRVAEALGAIDHPDARRLNQTPIPRMGGIAIFGSFIVTLALGFIVASKLGMSTAFNPRGSLAFGAGAVAVFLTGVVDDVKGLRPRTKLLCELLAATLVTAIGGCQLQLLSTPWGSVDIGWWTLPLTIAWIVGITNAVNLLDGMDGLASGVVAIALTAIVAAIGINHASSILAIILIGACVGFLVHNSHPATIFMGDSGSLFLGMSLGVLSTYANVKGSTSFVVAIPLLVVGLPLTDILWAMGRRYVKGLVPTSLHSHAAGLARMFVPDKNHIHHRLLAAGLDQRRATYVLYGIQALASLVALYLVVSWSKPAAPEAPLPATAVVQQPRDQKRD